MLDARTASLTVIHSLKLRHERSATRLGGTEARSATPTAVGSPENRLTARERLGVISHPASPIRSRRDSLRSSRRLPFAYAHGRKPVPCRFRIGSKASPPSPGMPFRKPIRNSSEHLQFLPSLFHPLTRRPLVVVVLDHFLRRVDSRRHHFGWNVEAPHSHNRRRTHVVGSATRGTP